MSASPTNRRSASEAYRRLAAAHADGAQLAVATYDGVRGNPVLLARSLWAEANELEGDVGARQLMKTPRCGRGAVRGHRSAVDVDTPEDLEQLNEERQ